MGKTEVKSQRLAKGSKMRKQDMNWSRRKSCLLATVCKSSRGQLALLSQPLGQHLHLQERLQNWDPPAVTERQSSAKGNTMGEEKSKHWKKDCGHKTDRNFGSCLPGATASLVQYEAVAVASMTSRCYCHSKIYCVLHPTHRFQISPRQQAKETEGTQMPPGQPAQ